MVLEPSVRVMAGHLREELKRAELSRSAQQIAAE